MRVGVIGASGYAGGELLRLLESHPEFEISYIAAGSNSGELITSIHSHLVSFSGLKFESVDLKKISTLDLLFLADRKSTRLNSSHEWISRMPSSA